MATLNLAPPPQTIRGPQSEIRRLLNAYTAPRGYVMVWKGGGGKPTSKRKTIIRYLRCQRWKDGCEMRISFKCPKGHDSIGEIEVMDPDHNHEPDPDLRLPGVSSTYTSVLLPSDIGLSQQPTVPDVLDNDFSLIEPRLVPTVLKSRSNPPILADDSFETTYATFTLPPYDFSESDHFLLETQSCASGLGVSMDTDSAADEQLGAFRDIELQQAADKQLCSELYWAIWSSYRYPLPQSLSKERIRQRFMEMEPHLGAQLRLLDDSPFTRRAITSKHSLGALRNSMIRDPGVDQPGFGYYGPRTAFVLMTILAGSRQCMSALRSSPVFVHQPRVRSLPVPDLIELIAVPECIALFIKHDLELPTITKAYEVMQESTELGLMFCGLLSELDEDVIESDHRGGVQSPIIID